MGPNQTGHSYEIERKNGVIADRIISHAIEALLTSREVGRCKHAKACWDAGNFCGNSREPDFQEPTV